ncbi:HYC_CC_PP family protein [Tenacibaculum crassostreae]|uniref:HYC_CC_PP family protein n=1 Tax=Tenacibaculum crassostreae TaxID=502683 RepID=UPI0038957940
MKIVITKTSSILLAFLLLFSTLSFAVEKHFCGDFLVDTSYFGEAESCIIETITTDSGVKKVKKKRCCKDEVEKIEGQDELQKLSIDKISFQQKIFIISYAVSYDLLFKSLEKQFIPHKNYNPPNLFYDLNILHEVFII